jgi:NitT/TauT family transport system substrate-binding protein
MQQSGIALGPRLQDPRAKYLFPSNLTVNDDDLKKLAPALIGVARGIAKAQLFSETNPEAAVRIHWKVYPQSAPREGVTDEAVKREAEVLALRVQMQSKNAVGTNRFGDVPLDQIRAVQEYFVSTGQMEKTLDPAGYYSNDVIGQINDFDNAAIVKLAKEFKLQ